MGSVRQRLSEARHECNVVMVGDCKVGKTALVTRFVNTKFSENYRATSLEKLSATAIVASRRVKYNIWDTTGSRSNIAARNLAYREADVFMLCYKISDPSTLFSALNFWCPEIRAMAPSTPVVLVGCQSDLRGDREILYSLAKQGKAPISSEQALTFSQQIAALMYVETSARFSLRNAISAFEVAALASMGKLKLKEGTSPRSTPSPRSIKKQRFSSCSPGDSLDRTGNSLEASDQFWEQFQAKLNSPKLQRSQSECPKTPSLGSRSSASLSSKTKSSTSIPSITSTGTTCKTPKSLRRGSKANNSSQEQMITIKCQRLTADKTYEEIEVEVPAPIYETIQLYNDVSNSGLNPKAKERRSFGHKLRNFFTSSSKS